MGGASRARSVRATREPTHRDETRAGACLAASCAFVLSWLVGTRSDYARSVLAQGLAAMREGATFSNARVLLNRLFGVRSEVV